MRCSKPDPVRRSHGTHPDTTPSQAKDSLRTNLSLGKLETASSPQPSPPEEEREKKPPVRSANGLIQWKRSSALSMNLPLGMLEMASSPRPLLHPPTRCVSAARRRRGGRLLVRGSRQTTPKPQKRAFSSATAPLN